ncbi:S8 family serine peptidase [Trichocoleus sp. DQ-A3]|uniref:S8 family serine peptidase n=1 Tax=Cyanophyceae TaxID=3028117 RepID=UPI0016889F01|nr:S8 family serine peptidase [Coleofasciculus sp. FACHB-125]MBD1903891.1 S8 family serine peptidase [Coleofasciculus sp. FACHB-125]
MGLFKFFSKKRAAAIGFQPQKSPQKTSLQTFILEPILTPSGLLDGGDSAPDPVVMDWNMDTLADVDLPEMDVDADAADAIADVDILDSDGDATDAIADVDLLDADADTDATDTVTDVELPDADGETDATGTFAASTYEMEISDADIEPVGFFYGDKDDSLTAIAESNSTIGSVDLPDIDADTDANASVDLLGSVGDTDATDAIADVEPDTDGDTDAIADVDLPDIDADTDATDASVDVDLLDTDATGADADTEIPDDGIEAVDFVYNDANNPVTDVIQPSPPFNSGVFTVGETGEVSIDFLFDGGQYQGELAVFSLDGMDGFEPGSEAFIKEAASRALSNSELGHIVIADATEGARFSGALPHEGNFNTGAYQGVKTFSMRPGGTFGVMLVPHGTVQQLFDNPAAEGYGRPLFSMTTSKPTDLFHMGQIADVTGDGNTFVMEDMRVDGWTDKDYNDVIFQVRGAKAQAVHLDDVIDSGKDWRNTDMGQALIAYAEPYVTPDTDDGGAIAVDPILDLEGTVDDGGAIAVDTIPDFEDSVDDGEAIAVDTIPDNEDIAENPADSTDVVEEHTHVEEVPVTNTVQPQRFEFAKANQPLVGVIDTGFSANNPDIDYSRIILGQDRVNGDANPLLSDGEGNEHGTHILGIIGATQDNGVGIDGINDDAPLWVGRAIGSGKWADSLVEFVDAAKESGQPNAVVNLSLDLTQVNRDGSVTTRYEFTPAERAAIEYARQHNVLIVAAAGNDGGVMSVLGQASQEFDNIITVGAAERVNDEVALSKAFDRAAYSSYGNGLDIMAPGGTVENPELSTTGDGVGTMAGTSVASAKVTGAVSQVWAANPGLSYRQVIEILKNTAADLKTPGWDGETGAGLLNMAAAVHLAKATQPELLPVKPLPIEPPKDEEPEVQESVIKITPEMGFLPEPIKLTDDIWFLGGPSPDELNLIGGFSNRNAADTTNADQLWSGGGLGLNLNGSGVTVGVWDQGKVRNTHQEFGSRVVISDSASNFNDHATHVAGTIGATGVNSEARGMANQVNIRSYDWNNHFQELEAAAKTGLSLSNHSYGKVIGWTSGIDWSGIGVYGAIDTWWSNRALFSEAEAFGKYGQGSNDLDRILYNNPNLLSVWAAGNDRSDSFGNQSGNNTYVSYFSSNPGNIPNWQKAGWYKIPNSSVTTAPGKDGGNSGYDTLSSEGAVAKNTLVVGAINAITADPYNNSNVVMSSFSNWGPTDDGRLKVDVVGNGIDVYSTLASSDTAYKSSSGTSMATPNVTGTAALLTQHYKNLYGVSPRSATLKGVITHTAFDAGNKGPDYTYGWGVVDGAAAATFLTNAKNQVTNRLIESTYIGFQQSYQITSNGSGSLKATLVWTDPPGTPHGNGLDETTRVLVNDLDLSITAPNGQVFYPWTLDPNNPSAPAVRTTRNHVDNIEQVLIDTPMPGTYTINVNHSGNSFTQAYSLLVSGISNPLDNPIGRGSRAPNLFIDAYNRVNGQGRGLKAQGDAYRWGNGWTQRFLDSNNNEVLIMLEDGQNKAYVVWGEILKEYKNVGGPVGANLPGGGWAYLGYPRSDEKGGTSSKGSPLAIQEFAGENGKARLYYHWNNGNRVATWGSIGAFYINIGGHNHWLGAPTKREYIDGDTIFADFEGGRIGFRISDGKTEALQPGQQPSWRQRPSWEIAIDQAYSASPVGLGSPLSGYFDATKSPQGTTGKYRVYQNGTIHWTPQYGAVPLWYDLQREYSEYSFPNGSGGWLGFPTKREYAWNGGMRTDFEGGYIFWNGQRAKAYQHGQFP